MAEFDDGMVLADPSGQTPGGSPVIVNEAPPESAAAAGRPFDEGMVLAEELREDVQAPPEPEPLPPAGPQVDLSIHDGEASAFPRGRPDELLGGPEGAWSYSGNPKANSKDAVRFLIQDTDNEATLLLDAEVEWCVEQECSSQTKPSLAELHRAAALALEALARKFAAQADTQIGSLHTKYSVQAKQYDERAKDLRNRAAGMAPPIMLGASESEKEALESDTDRVQESFTRGQFLNPWKGPTVAPGPVRPGEGPL